MTRTSSGARDERHVLRRGLASGEECRRPLTDRRDEYLLTEAGTAIGPVLRELRIWGETYAR